MKANQICNSLFRQAALSALIVACLSAAWSQQMDPVLFQDMRWRLIGPFRGGRVLAVSGIASQHDTYYFGSVDGGVWKTANDGLTWAPIFDGQPAASVGALAVAPSDPNILYVGTGEADMRSNISLGQGVYKSTDAGLHWQFMGLPETRQIGRIIVNPTNPNIVLLAALGHAYGPNPERGVYRSADGGKTWQKVLYKDENTGAIDLAFNPTDANVVYAGLWQVRRPPWSVYPPQSGPGSGLYKSTDGGLTWTQLTGNGLPAGDWGRIGIAVARQDGGKRVYASIDAKEGGLFRSDDAGASWQRVGADKRGRERAWYFSEVIVDPKDPDTVYLPRVALYRSTDGGKSFAAIKGAPGGDDYHALWIDPNDPSRIILGCDQGASISLDRGLTWSSWYNQPTAQFYHVATDNQFPYNVYGAQQDSGTIVISSRSNFGAINFRDWQQTGGGESGYIVPDPNDSNTVYAGETYGSLARYDKRTGLQQDISPAPAASFGTAISQRDLRFTWTSPVVFSPQNSHVLYMGSQFVLRTADHGMSWQQISPDLTGCDPQQKSAADAVTLINAKARCYGVVYTIAPSSVSEGTIWAGTDTGLIHITRDNGATWSNVTPPQLGDWSKISLLEASPHDAGTAYAAVDRHRLDDVAPYIYRTRDFGKSWEKITAGISTPAYVNVVREDPIRKGLLFAGTETGIYISFDDGDRWQPLQLNLPVVSVRDLVIHGDDLVIATHGRSFWILDDIAALRQLRSELAGSKAYLFTPQTAIRLRHNANNSTPLPPEVAAGQNPPAGAILDYYLKSQPQSAITLEILDASGNLVRKYSSADAPITADLSAPIAPYWFRTVSPLASTAGMHRFAWDLRYPSPPTVRKSYSSATVYGENTPAQPEGPLAVPGDYQLRLTVDGDVFTQPLTLKSDPRVRASAADLKQQLAVALEISSTMRADHAAYEQIANLRAQLMHLQDTLVGKSGKPRSKKTAEAAAVLQHKAAVLAHVETDDPASSGALDQLNATLATLEEDAESGDQPPTAQVQQAFQRALQELTSALAQWQRLQQQELATLNVLLAAQKLSPLCGDFAGANACPPMK